MPVPIWRASPPRRPLAAGTDPGAVATDPAATALVDGAVTTTAVGADLVDLDGGEDTTAEGSCTMDKLSVRLGDSGNSVTCLQQALITAGFYTGAVNGQFDQATFDAVEDMQTRLPLVDGRGRS